MDSILNKQLWVFSPSGALTDPKTYAASKAALLGLSYTVGECPHAQLRDQRFAGTDAQRLVAIEHALQQPGLSIATRGGYGITRVLADLDFAMLINGMQKHGTILCGHSDITGLQLALLAACQKTGLWQHLNTTNHALINVPIKLLHGPMLCFDFGAAEGIHPVTLQHWQSAWHQGLVDVAWASHIALDPFFGWSETMTGMVWGGNLTMLCSLLSTPYFPNIEHGILILEDINEPVYRIERMLLQLVHAGVLQTQRAIVLGQFNEPAATAHDGDFNLHYVAHSLAKRLKKPVLTGFPFGHSTPKCSFYQGCMGELSKMDHLESRFRLRQHIKI